MTFTTKLKNKLKHTTENFTLFTVGKYIRYIQRPKLPQQANGKHWLHIGCGLANDPRYINMDTRPGLHIHVVDTIQNIHKHFGEKRLDLVYACHILEHIPYAEISGVLRKIYFVLKKNGVFRISVPNFKTIVAMYQEKHQLEDILPPLMGGQGYADNFHYIAYDKDYLTRMLKNAGFKEVREWNPHTTPEHTFDDWAARTFPLYGKNWPISLNIEGIK